MWLDFAYLLIGGLGVWIGAEGLVRGAVRLAAYFGVSSLIIGLTVVAFGTSAPELVVSSLAAMRGHSQIALGNVLGSNVINIGLVLGLSVVIAPISVSSEVLKRDIPFVIIATLATVILAWHGSSLGQIDGVLLLLGFVGYSYINYRLALQEQARNTAAPGWQRQEIKASYILMLVGGIILLPLGAEGMVSGAVGLAEAFNVDKRIIAMTIVAFGTSVPELAASMVAAKHGESDLALGNVVGSNIYNLLLILGTSVLIAPIKIHLTARSFDFMLMVLITLLLAPLISRGRGLSRVDGIILLSIYVLFNVCIMF